MSARSRCPIRGSTSWRAIAKSAQIIPTRLTFVDIAGLVRGASKGEGLGNQFLANIREVDAIAHVRALLRGCRRHPCRGPDRSDRRHRDDRDRIDARRSRQPGDAASIALEKKAKRQRQGGQGSTPRSRQPRAARCCATASRRACVERKPEEEKTFAMLGLLTSKPVLYVCNVDEGVGRDRQRIFPQGRSARQGGRRRRRRDLGQDRSRDRRARRARSARTISRPSG